MTFQKRVLGCAGLTALALLALTGCQRAKPTDAGVQAALNARLANAATAANAGVANANADNGAEAVAVAAAPTIPAKTDEQLLADAPWGITTASTYAEVHQHLVDAGFQPVARDGNKYQNGRDNSIFADFAEVGCQQAPDSRACIAQFKSPEGMPVQLEMLYSDRTRDYTLELLQAGSKAIGITPATAPSAPAAAGTAQ